MLFFMFFFFFQAEDGIRDSSVTGVQTCALPIYFVDIYNRSGLYPVQLPSGLGGEGAGVVVEVGPGVTDLKPGDRVAYGSAPLRAYAGGPLIPAEPLLQLPHGLDDNTAASLRPQRVATP